MHGEHSKNKKVKTIICFHLYYRGEYTENKLFSLNKQGKVKQKYKTGDIYIVCKSDNVQTIHTCGTKHSNPYTITINLNF